MKFFKTDGNVSICSTPWVKGSTGLFDYENDFKEFPPDLMGTCNRYQFVDYGLDELKAIQCLVPHSGANGLQMRYAVVLVSEWPKTNMNKYIHGFFCDFENRRNDGGDTLDAECTFLTPEEPEVYDMLPKRDQKDLMRRYNYNDEL